MFRHLNGKIFIKVILFALILFMPVSSVMAFTNKPIITKINGCNDNDCRPNVASPGDTLQIIGGGFVTPVNENKIYIGGQAYTVTSGDESTLYFEIPTNFQIKTYTVVVQNSNGSSDPYSVTMVSSSSGGSPKMTFSSTDVQNDEFIIVNLTGGTPGALFCLYSVDTLKDPTSNAGKCDTNSVTIKSDGTAQTKTKYVLTKTDRFEVAGVIKTSDGRYTEVGRQAITVTVDGGDGGQGIAECDALPDIPPTQKQGMSGNPVKCIQQILKNKGLYSGTIDGIFGSQTFKAVKEYQKKSDLNCVDGVVGPETWGALLDTVIDQQTKCNDVNGTNPPPSDTTPTGKTGAPECNNDPGLQYVNGLCLPLGRPTGNGLISCSSIGDCVSRVIKVLLTLGGIIAVVFIIIGGYQYMTSAGNEESAGKGKKTLLYAVIGLAVILLAYTIVTVVFNSLTKDSILGQAKSVVTVQKSV